MQWLTLGSRSRLRASDADRERVVQALRRHCAEGRLTADELDERLDRAFAARTLGELDRLVIDLPGEVRDPVADFISGATSAAMRATRMAMGITGAVFALVLVLPLIAIASSGRLQTLLAVVAIAVAVILGRWFVRGGRRTR